LKYCKANNRSRNKPCFILVGGINGAGKSTFAQGRASFEAFAWDVGSDLEVINPDIVTKQLLSADSDLSLKKANLLAAKACEQRVWEIINQGTGSFAIETVLSTDKYKSVVQRAIEQNYHVQFVYVMVGSVNEAIERVRLRVSKGVVTLYQKTKLGAGGDALLPTLNGSGNTRLALGYFLMECE
jgi:predicted ABC-type ATPase